MCVMTLIARVWPQPREFAYVHAFAFAVWEVFVRIHSDMQDLADWNEKYEKRFGHIFIICAAGKSAAFMLDTIKARCIGLGALDKLPCILLTALIPSDSHVMIPEGQLHGLCANLDED